MSLPRVSPNPGSKILSRAIIAGAGISLPGPEVVGEIPPGMAAILLFVPIEEITTRNPLEIQADIGLPWSMRDNDPVWLDELMAKHRED